MKLGAAAACLSMVLLAIVSGPAQAERGSDGNVKILYWQAPSTLNPFLSGGVKDVAAASIIVEPLAHYDEKAEIVPILADHVPSLANGEISADLTTITWKLKKGVVWSDGTPFTSADVVFSANYCMDPQGGCQYAQNFTDVKNVEAIDDLTVKVTFRVAKPFPFGPFVGSQSPIIQKAQFKDCTGPKVPQCSEQNYHPIGTGPFKVIDFKPNDVVSYTANPLYRDPAKPAFATVTLKGGGDPVSAARAVLQTGEFDYAWNLQVEPEVLTQMTSGGRGEILRSFGTGVERLDLNLTNPDAKAGDKRSTTEVGPHPFLGDPAVRRALSLAIDRDALVEAGYGDSGQVSCNVLAGPEIYASTANEWCRTPDVAAANKMLDDAGWVRGPDGIRAKGGVKLSILFTTTVNSVRQGTQALIKQMWSDIGVETELRGINAGVYFGGDPGNPDTYQKFYADVEMFTNYFNGNDPEKFMAIWRCSGIPRPATNWLGANISRYCDPAYDALVDEMGKTSEPGARIALAKKMNDMLVQAGAIIPMIRRGDVSAKAKSLDGVRMNSWDSELWNIADWSRRK